jgi:hypothetical protein
MEEPEAAGAQAPSAEVAISPEARPETAALTEAQPQPAATPEAEPQATATPGAEPRAAATFEAEPQAAPSSEAEPQAAATPEADAAFPTTAEVEPADGADAESARQAAAEAEVGFTAHATAEAETEPAAGATAAAEPAVAATIETEATASVDAAAEAEPEADPARDAPPAEAPQVAEVPETASPEAAISPQPEAVPEPETALPTQAAPPAQATPPPAQASPEVPLLTEAGPNADLTAKEAEAVEQTEAAQQPQTDHEAETAQETQAADEAVELGDKPDIKQVDGSKGEGEPQAQVEVQVRSEREPEADVEVETNPEQSDPDATAVLILPTEARPGSATKQTEPDRAEPDKTEPQQDRPSVEDAVVLRGGPTIEDTVILTVPEKPAPEAAPQRSPGEDTVVIVPRAHDDTVVIPVVSSIASVAPPTDVVTAVIPVVPGRRDGQRTEVAPPPDPGRKPKPARARREPLDLGHAPAVLTISALGVLMVALAYAGGRVSTGNAQFAYWVGQVVVFTPVVVRLLSRRMAGVAESFLLVMGLALHQYLLKWMYSPDQFRFPDELQHWLATTIIVQSGELFQPNPALPPAEHFPGLAELGAAVAEMTGLPVTAAGVIVAGIAHLVFVGVLFAVVLRASNSPAVAGVACATYATALHYLFFNSMFLYQTAALPFFMLAVWAVRRWRAEGGRMFAALAVVSMALTTVSHHVTALALVATLLLLAVAELVVDQPRRWSALAMPGAAAVVVAAWILLVATDVLGYLEEPVDQVVRTVSQLFSSESDPASKSAPVSVGQLVVQGAGLLGLLVLYLAVTRDMVHRRDRDWWRWAAVAGGMVFFAGNGVRFLGQNGPEIAGRLSTFTYIPISILAAIGLVRGVQLIPAKDEFGHRWRAAAPAIDVVMPGGWNLYSRVAAGSAMITLLMIGARAGGWPPIASILPGPYLAGGYERSVDAYGVASADWQRTTLGPGNRVGGDATSVSLASTYGRQDPVREVGSLYYADVWGLEQDDLVQRVHVQYLVVDRRLSTQLPESGAYFESDPRSGQITSPLTAGQLGKFDTLAGMDRLYDNGTVRIYRTGVQ